MNQDSRRTIAGYPPQREERKNVSNPSVDSRERALLARIERFRQKMSDALPSQRDFPNVNALQKALFAADVGFASSEAYLPVGGGGPVEKFFLNGDITIAGIPAQLEFTVREYGDIIQLVSINFADQLGN